MTLPDRTSEIEPLASHALSMARITIAADSL